MDSSIKRKTDLLRGVKPVTIYSEYSRVCAVCDKKELPNATIIKEDFWLCESCLNALKNLINSNK